MSFMHRPSVSRSGTPFTHRILVALLISLIAALAGCGHQLRGSGALPAALRATYISNPSDDWKFKRALIRGIERAGGDVLSSPEGASSTLRIDQVRVERNTLSISDTGRINEYEISLIVAYTLIPAGGNSDTATRQTLTLRNDYQYDPSLVLAKSAEQEQITAELRDKAVQRILTRLRYQR